MTDSKRAAKATLPDPGVVLDEPVNIGRSAVLPCSDLENLVDEEVNSEDSGAAEERSASDDTDTMTMVLVMLLFAGFLAVCGVGIVQMMRADEAAFVRRLEQRMPQVQARHIQVEVDLAQLYTGDDIQINVDRMLVCSKCAGTGDDATSGYHTCHKCQGTGVHETIEQVGPFQQRMRSVCNVCQGRGRVANNKCNVCKGKGLRREAAKLSVHIERGVRHGDELLLIRQGDQALHHVPGHVVVHVVVHLNGRIITLNREAVVQPATVWKIPDEGMPRRGRPGKFGYLFVHFNIVYPMELDAAAYSGKDAK
ncbi:Heat shock protein DnaJ family protein, partial [Phytophthora palmivora]